MSGKPAATGSAAVCIKRLRTRLKEKDALIENLIRDNTRLKEALGSLRQTHYVCEDCWYSCPKSGECCDDERKRSKMRLRS